MKTKTFLIILISLFHFCSCKQDASQMTVVVKYTESEGIDLLTMDYFSGFEVIQLSGADSPMLGIDINIQVVNDRYYIGDVFNSEKVHIYSDKGEYIRSVGEKGNGPEEYLSLSEFSVDKNGDVSIYSAMGEGSVYRYSENGDFLSKTDCPYSSYKYISHKGVDYYYHGEGSGSEYKLYIVEGSDTAKYLKSPNLLPMTHLSPALTRYNDNIYLSEPYGNVVYKLNGSQMDSLYFFDFGKYNTPDEFYQFEDRFDAYFYILPKDFATKGSFFDSDKYSFMSGAVNNFEQEIERYFYGILDKKSDTWRWFYMKDGDFLNSVNLKYIDNDYAYFVAEPAMIPSGAAVKLGLTNASEDDNIVIIKCKFRR